jgi:hypothetical protein
MKPSNYDRTKLPKWAQQEFERLEANIKSLEKERREMMGESNKPTNVYIWDGMDLIKLPRRTQIRFGDDSSRAYFDVRIDEDGQLRILGGDWYSIYPEASNAIRLTPRGK